jgi:hypothetical protein
VLQVSGSSEVGSVSVFSSSEQGHTPEQMAEMALAKIMEVNGNAPPAIRDQAIAYRENIRYVLTFYFHQMAKSERTTIWALLKKQGHEEMAEIIRRL